ncbi:MAG TPA: winged helix-turn-helix domain-containing protein [Candidatus Nitrosotenuis sp.]|nr:winged helix-turn-helix domain-containing protein [Candidatus Nitrosotenuis sp.]
MMNEKIDPQEQNEKFLKPIFILGRFGAAYRTRSEIKKTKLQNVTNLRWDALDRYVDWLIYNEFLQCKKVGRNKTYVMTEHGRKALTILATFVGCLK